MKKMFMMMLLSIVSWTGAVTATEATAPLKSNGPVAQQEAVVAADTLNGMTPSEAFQIRMKELEFERDRVFFQSESDTEDIIDSLVPLFAIVSPFLIAFLIVFFYIYYRNKKVQSRYRVMEKAIESGRELPEGFFDEPESKRPSKFSTLNQGLVCTAAVVDVVFLKLGQVIDSVVEVFDDKLVVVHYRRLLLGDGVVVSAGIVLIACEWHALLVCAVTVSHVEMAEGTHEVSLAERTLLHIGERL
jgi:hypothetical protein